MGERLAAYGLSLHPVKTRLVYCKDGRRREAHPHTTFDFLGFTIRARTMQDREGKLFTGFGPAVSQKALKRMSQAIRSLSLNLKFLLIGSSRKSVGRLQGSASLGGAWVLGSGAFANRGSLA